MTLTPARIASVLTGLAYLALGLVTLTTGGAPDRDWGVHGAVIDVLGLLAFAANIPAAERLREALGLTGLGLVALRVTQLGLLAMSVESVASLVHGGNTLTPVFFGGFLLTALGLLVVAVVGVIRGTARWVAPLPFVGLFLGIAAGDHGGFALTGVVWLVLALTAVGSAMNHPTEPHSSSASLLRSTLPRGPR